MEKYELDLGKYGDSWSDILRGIEEKERNSDERIRLYTKILKTGINNSVATGDLCSKIDLATTELKQMAMTDELTKLYNRRFFDDSLNKTIARVKRGEAASLVLVDIDCFKKINDNYGHNIGDKILIELGNTLKNNVRLSDEVCRYGGEEFGIILPNTERENALDLAYKLNRKVDSFPIKIEGGNGKKYNLPVTISIGVDGIRKGDSKEDLLNRVDSFLYKAKFEGRNLVVGPNGIYMPKN